MALTSSETEVKYDAADEVVLPALDGLPQVTGTGRPTEDQLEADYYDTADLRLLRHGITLRRREGGGDAGWHLKLPAGPDTREEIRLPLAREGTPVPGELVDLVRSRTDGEALTPVATISTHRRSISLLGAAGEPVAVVADDRVVARPQAAGAEPQRWREVEVELTGGGPDLLHAADRLLRQHGLRRAAQSAKLERVLSSRLPNPAEEGLSMTRSTPAHQVITSYLEAQAETLRSLDPLVRRFRPDAVHKMRVATRRLRSTLRTFGTILRRAETEHVAAELKWLSDTLGACRDDEVLAGHLDELAAQTDVAQLMGPVQARIRAHFARSGAVARAAVLRALDSPRYAKLLAELDVLIRQPPLGPEANAAAGPVLTAAVGRAYRKTEKRMRRALATPPGAVRDAALHQARKAAKRARYAAEAAASVVGRDARRLARRLKVLQAVLGSHQDTVVARQTERRLGITAHLAGESAFTYGLFYGQDACTAQLLRYQAAQAWQEASRPRCRRWLHA